MKKNLASPKYSNSLIQYFNKNCYVDSHRVSSLSEKLKNGILFTNGKISVLSGFIPHGVVVEDVNEMLNISAGKISTWIPLFDGKIYKANIKLPFQVDYEFHRFELLLDINDIGNFARAASVVIPCAHLQSRGSRNKIIYIGSNKRIDESNTDSVLVLKELWAAIS